MIHINIDPYDMLIQHNVRITMLEEQMRQLQAQHQSDTKTIERQQKTITQLLQNEQVLSDAVGHLLLKQPK